MSSAEREEDDERLRRHEEGEDDDDRPQADAVEDGAPGPDRGRHPAEEPRADEGDELHEEEHPEHRRLREAELLGAVDARAADDGLDAVVEEEVGERGTASSAGSCARSRNVLRSCAMLPPTTPAERSTGVSTVPVRWRRPR